MLLKPLLLAEICVEKLLFAVYWLIVTLATYIRIRRFAAKFPAGGRAWPLIGDLHVVFSLDERDIVRYFVNYARKKQSGIIWIGILPVFYVWDPRDVERVLCNTRCQEKTRFYQFLESALGKGLITSSGETWQRHNKIISPTFHARILDSFIPTFNRQVDVFIDILRKSPDGKVYDILPAAELLTLDIICETAMGVNMKIQTGSAHEYLNAFHTLQECILERGMRPWLHLDWTYAMSSIGRREKAAQRITNGVRDRVIRERKKMLDAGGDLTPIEEGKKLRLAFLDHLLLSVKAGAELSDEEIADEVDTFMAAGAETISILISYALFEMARYTNVQEKAVEELLSIYDPSLPSIDVSPEELSRMTYLEMVLKETLRLHPPAPMAIRRAGEDIHLATSDLVIPADAQVAVLLSLTHWSADNYSDPDEFDPERFSPETSQNRHPFAFLPFSAGQRICIGRRFAMLEAKVIIAKVLWQYRFSPDPSFEPVDKWGISLKPANGLLLKIQKRR